MLDVRRRSLIFLALEEIDSQDLTGEMLPEVSSVMWISTSERGLT